jgi:hypothetical protein
MTRTAKTITLTHYDRGQMDVAIADDATWWMRKRHWFCPDDPELGIFEDEDFDETQAEIDKAWAIAVEDEAEERIANSQFGVGA